MPESPTLDTDDLQFGHKTDNHPGSKENFASVPIAFPVPRPGLIFSDNGYRYATHHLPWTPRLGAKSHPWEH